MEQLFHREKRWESVSRSSKGCKRQSMEEVFIICELKSSICSNRLLYSQNRMESNHQARCSDLGVDLKSITHNSKSVIKWTRPEYHKFSSQIMKSQCRFAHVPNSESAWMTNKLSRIHSLKCQIMNSLNLTLNILRSARSQLHLTISRHVTPTRQVDRVLHQTTTISQG